MNGSVFNLISCIDQDCQKILSTYAELQTVRFAQFSEKWKEMNFLYVHCAVKDGREKLDKDRNELTTALLTVSSKYISSDYPFEVRIGALYLLYCLYFTQICEPKSKVRLDLSLFEDICNLHHKIIIDKHSDADYIFRSLKKDYAFYIVATLSQMSMRYHATVPTHTEELEDFLREDHSYLNLLFSTNTLHTFSRVHSEYENIKKIISKKHSSLFSSTHSNMTDILYGEIQSFFDWRINICSKIHFELNFKPNCSIIKSLDKSHINPKKVIATRNYLPKNSKLRSASTNEKISIGLIPNNICPKKDNLNKDSKTKCKTKIRVHKGPKIYNKRRKSIKS